MLDDACHDGNEDYSTMLVPTLAPGDADGDNCKW